MNFGCVEAPKTNSEIGQYILKTYCFPNSPEQLNLSSNVTEQVKEWTESQYRSQSHN